MRPSAPAWKRTDPRRLSVFLHQATPDQSKEKEKNKNGETSDRMKVYFLKQAPGFIN